MENVGKLLRETEKLGISQDYVLGYLHAQGYLVVNGDNCITSEEYTEYFNSLLMYFMESDIEDETLNLVKTTVILNVNEISLLHDLINSATQLVEDRSRLIHRDFFKLLNEKFNDLIDLDNKLFDCVMPNNLEGEIVD
ncbi:MAG: hypothetical protein ACLSD0_03775 [Coprobacillus cateniformis]